ncbi:cysteine--tRNA ligase [Pararhizobium mangrovi]|uniref:Cysteine--tRNA ligase n=1 Tax=Pararhizobium mangrovi TaxID=2590452 RepID=A0A506UH23_9HYPH|nr:cysteine--tRNA ligase [Pararhizobium mangrovi]TPW32017.1 cysteine--tRNA ligase [Pararhizobium mangrovi]
MKGGGEFTLKFTDTLTREKTALSPIDPLNVRLYVCGPTVYDFAHIGNARPVVVFDVVFRLLRHVYGADHVTYVRNITDVDDKINARALRDFPDEPLNAAIRKVTETTAAQFRADVEALRCLTPSVEPRATEFVLARQDGRSDMVGLIQKLVDRGHAYESAGEMLFDVASMPAYGQLSRRKLDEQQAGARVAVEAHKKNPNDFVLWKQSAEDEPGWEATFRLADGERTIRGRPGWHIECSAMSAAYLGEVFDIHGGGLDLIFPHHENEIAQSCCAHGTERMANLWLHNGFVQVDGRKMSKSEGNFVTIRDLLSTDTFGGRAWPGEVLRLAIMMTHYREPMDFTAGRLREATNVLDRWERIISATRLQEADPHPEFMALIADDLNVPEALSLVHSLIIGSERDVSQALACLSLLGLDPRRDVELDTAVEGMIGLRLHHIREKNFVEADRIRDELAGRGIRLKDAKDPSTGERTTTWEVER